MASEHKTTLNDRAPRYALWLVFGCAATTGDSLSFISFKFVKSGWSMPSLPRVDEPCRLHPSPATCYSSLDRGP